MQIGFITALCFALLDIPVTLVSLMHGKNFNLILQSLENFQFDACMVDVLIFSLLRTSLVIGAMIGVLKNPVNGRQRCCNVKKLAFFISCMNGYYVCIKLLLYSESYPNKYGNDVWFWLIFSWNLFGAAVFIYQWSAISSYKRTSSYGNYLNHEKTPLLQNNENSSTVFC